MRKLFKERKLFNGGNYMRKYGTYKNHLNIGGPFLRFDANPLDPKWYQYGIVHGSPVSCDGGTFPSIFIRLDNEDIWTWIRQKVFPAN